jgi:hypothetical protein
MHAAANLMSVTGSQHGLGTARHRPKKALQRCRRRAACTRNTTRWHPAHAKSASRERRRRHAALHEQSEELPALPTHQPACPKSAPSRRAAKTRHVRGLSSRGKTQRIPAANASAASPSVRFLRRSPGAITENALLLAMFGSDHVFTWLMIALHGGVVEIPICMTSCSCLVWIMVLGLLAVVV